MGEGFWPPAPCGRTGALASSTVVDRARLGKKGVAEIGVLLQRGRLEFALRPLPTHCSWAQKGSLDVAPRACSGSFLSLLAQLLELVGFLAVGRRCF